MTKIAILSDLHGNMPAIEKVLADLTTREVERVFCLGDLASSPLWPRESIELCMQQDWTFIRGNHDRNLVERAPEKLGDSDAYAYKQLDNKHLDWLATLPSTLEVDDTFLLCHGSPTKDTTYLLETIESGRVRLSTPEEIKPKLNGTRLPILLCGHSHTPRVVTLESGLTIINPGSVGVPAYEDASDGYFVVENGSPHARYAVIEKTTEGWKPEIILIPYDHELAAAQAHKNKRPDYEIGLRTGFMRGDSVPIYG
ncbi:MAG: YfcE family phosphodiesterase [Anaerolinea sp.]|nr:YfcE family phosphodiesterase [Anaerolinea sp.]